MLLVPPSFHQPILWPFLRTCHYTAFLLGLLFLGNTCNLGNWLWDSHQCWGCNTALIQIIGRRCNVYGCLMFVSLKVLAWAWEGQESIKEHGHTMRLTWKYPYFPYETADGTVPFHSWSLKIPFCSPLLHLLKLGTLCTDVVCGMWAASLAPAVHAVCSRASTENWLQINLVVGTEWMNSCMVNYAEWYRKM